MFLDDIAIVSRALERKRCMGREMRKRLAALASRAHNKMLATELSVPMHSNARAVEPRPLTEIQFFSSVGLQSDDAV